MVTYKPIYPQAKLALLGGGISHSLSPFIHKYWLDKYGLVGGYDLLHKESLSESDLKNLSDSGFVGLNVTMPFKKDVLSFLDHKDDLVEKVGAANTLLFQDGLLRGTNTDATAFKRLIEPYLPLKTAVVLGGGGASLATLWALDQVGVKDMRVVVRQKNISFPARIYPWSQVNEASDGCDVFINATPLGMAGKPEQISLPPLPPRCLVVDWVYYPQKTTLLSQAERAFHPTLDGIDLLLAQAQDAFYFWFGIHPEITSELRQGLREVHQPGL